MDNNATESPSWQGINSPVYALDEVDSTSSELKRRLLTHPDLPDYTVVTARHQTAGHGRLDRVWFDDGKSSLLLSTVVTVDAQHLGWVTLLAAIATARAIREFLQAAEETHTALDPLPAHASDNRDEHGDALHGPQAVRLRWPNDLLYAGRKAGEIVTQLLGGADDYYRVIISIGVNLRYVPTDAPADATAIPLLENQSEYLGDAILARLAELISWIDNVATADADYSWNPITGMTLGTPPGFGHVNAAAIGANESPLPRWQKEYEKLLIGMNREVRFTGPDNQPHQLYITGVDKTGALCALDSQERPVRITLAQMSLPDAPSSKTQEEENTPKRAATSQE